MKSLFRKATFRNDRNEQPKFEKNPGPALNSTGNLTLPKMKRRYERIGNTAAVQPAVGGARSRSSNMEGNEMDLEPSGGGGGNSLCHEQDQLLIQIHVPEINVKKCLQFPKDQLVWDVKQQCLAALPKELKESFNYGLFCPPENGKAGKFLDEERRLGDYPFNGPMGYLELKYKRRVYKMISLDEKQLKSLHTRANLRRFLDYVSTGHVEKITKMCSKGLDPNFHCHESGETPLTLATGPKLSAKASKVLIALVNGGALLDYRARDGATAMHRAVDHRNIEAMRTLLQLGASPNYRDGRGLTPLYLSIAQAPDPVFAEMLLHDHATVGATDLHGWQEVHQACKTGLIKHLEHLLAYGANMNAQNASGNTPLHVCAVNGQETCARHLLFRGTNREALNYANQTPGQVAVIAGNMDLAELIQNYREEEIVPIRRPPSYNPNRRSAIGWLCRAPSIGCLISPTTESRHTSTLPHSQSSQQLPSIISPVLRSTHTPPKPVQQHPSTFHLRAGRGANAAPSNLHHPPPPPASPCPSDRSSVPYSSASSSLSEGSSGMMVVVNHRGHHRLMLGSHHDNTDTASIVTVLALGVTDKSALFGDTSDIISDSSGVGTANSDTTIGSGSISMPGSSVVCVETYIPDGNTCQNGQNGRDGHGHISIREGDIIEVTGATDDGYLEGTVKSSAAGQRTTGLFPSSCVQEVRLRYTSNIAEAAAAAAASLLPLAARDHATLTSTLRRASEDGGGSTGSNTTVGTAIGRVYGRRESLGTNSGSGSVVSGKCSNSVQFVDDDGDSVEGGGKKGLVHFATAPRSSSKKSFPSSDPRTVVLHRGRKGFGFILRGAKATSTLMELTPSSGHCPALQYLDDVDPGGVADMAGLRKGDFLLAINRESVSAASHEHVVELIRRSGELVEMTVVSVGSSVQHHSNNSTLPNSKSGIFHTSHDGASCVTLPPLSIARQYATLPRKTAVTTTAGGNSSANSSCCKSQAPLPPRRDPKTTLSVGRARAKSMVAGLETGRDCPPSPPDLGAPHDSMEGGDGGGNCQPPPPPHSCSSSSSHSSSHYHHSSATTTHQPPRTASIRQRPTSGRITSAELEELFQRQRQVENERVAGDVGRGGGGRVYASVADMKRSKSKGTNKIRFANPFRSISTALGDLHRDFHSTPDLAHALAQSTHLPTSITCSASLRNGTTTHHRPTPPQFAPPPPHHRSQEDVYFATGRGGMLPPPTHPPPPPPTTGQMVKVDVGGRVGGGGEGGYDVGGGAAMDGGVSVETIVSSFRPTTTAKLYESPADMKQSHVAYYNRSRSLPSSHATNRVRKAHSMRNPAVTAAISAVANPPPATIQATSFTQQRGGDSARDGGDGVAHRVMMVAGCNPYAQPMNRYHANGRPSRSHSTVGSANTTTVITSRTNTSTLPRAHTVDVCVGSPPPPPPPSSSNRAQSPTIPDPDYSCSEPEDELSDAEAVVVDLQQQQRLVRPADGMAGGGKLRMGANDTAKLNNRLNAVQLQPLENSGNSNASGSSSGSSSSSMPHSFSVDEIQKGRALLKSSKSYPDNLLAKAPAQTQTRKQQQALEDADNSSSGVSSDQEVNGGGGIVSDYAERLNCILTQQHLQHAVVQTKIYGKGVNRVQVNVQQQQSQRPTSSPAVSLIKLPPPQESDDTDEPSVCLPPPLPEYTPSPNASATDTAADPRHPNDEEGVVVLAPPPQFSDARQATRVRIVGAVPKTVTPPAGSVARM